MTLALSLLAVRAGADPFGDESSGLPGTSLVAKAWISDAVWVPPADGSGGFARRDGGSTTFSNALAGRPTGFTLNDTTRHVASLGNGGSVILSFPVVLHNGPGPDFVVFENGFEDATDFTGTTREGNTNSFAFLELAYVDVGSSTGAWARFPSTYLATEPLYVPYGAGGGEEGRFFSQDARRIDGLAGKHVLAFGTPFDVAVLTNDPAVVSGSVDLSAIRFIRITDVVGNGSVTDSAGRPIYDPFYDPVAGFPDQAPVANTDGFDLRGVAILQTLDAQPVLDQGGVTIRWFANAGTLYQVEAAASPVGLGWQPVGSVVTGASAWASVADTSSVPLRVYRVSSWRQP